jgi:molecular chaperone HtpG
MDTLIDMNFMSFMEFGGGMKDTQFVRVDADVSGLTEESEEGKDIDQGKMEKLFRDALNDPELTVKLEALSDKALPVMLTEDEQMRRYKEMSAIYGQDFSFPNKYTLVLNRQNATVQHLAAMEDQDTAQLLCRQLFDLSRLSSRPLEAEDLKNFIARSNELIARLAEKA